MPDPQQVATVSTGTDGTNGPSAQPATPPAQGGDVWDRAAALTPQGNQPAAVPAQGGDVWDQAAAINQGADGTSSDTSLQMNSGDNLGTTIAKGANAVGAGVGEGLLSTLNGGADMLHLPHQLLEQRQQELEQENAGNPTLNKIGYGGETLLEFMMGDEALKALPMAKRLEATAKTMRVFENSPRLMKAMQLGADALNTGARTGIVQGAQTLTRTGGDVGEAAKDAAIAGGTGTVIGGATGAIGAALGKGADAAATVSSMGDASANAPSEQSLFGDLSDQLTKHKAAIDDQFNNAGQAASDTRDQAVSAANAEKQSAEQGVSGTLSDQKDKAVDLLNDKKDQDATSLQDNLDKADRGLRGSKAYIKNTLVSGLDKLSTGASDTEELAGQVNEGINGYEKASHTDFEEGLNGENGVVTRLKGATEAVKGSPISDKAAELLNTPNPADHPAVAGMKSVSGDKIDASVKQKLQELADGETTKGEGENATKKPMPDWTAKSLIQFRQAARKASAGYMRGDINRRVLGDLINSVDDTLEKLAKNAGDPEAVTDYENLRSNYKAARENLDTSAADKLNLTDEDQALNDVNKYLTGGGNSLAKLDNIRKIVGDETMQNLAKSKVAQWKTLAQSNPQQFVKEFGAMSDAVKQSFFGDELTKNLQNLSDTFTHTSEYAESNAKTLIDSAKAAGTASKATTRQLLGNTGPGASQLGGLIGEGIKGANKTALEGIASKYEDAVNAAQDAFDQASTDAKGAHDAASEPFKGAFMKNLSEGRVNDALKNGQVDVQDIRNLKQVIGDKWSGIADGIFQRAVADASPAGRFDPEKMVKWWSDIKPEVRSEMFSADNPAALEKYQKAMANVSDAAGVKRLVKYFGAYPVVGGAAAGVGAAAGSVAGPAALGHLGEMVGGLTGVAGGAKLIKTTVEWVANHPYTWKALAKASAAAESPLAKATATGVRGAAAQATPDTHVFNATQWASHPSNQGKDKYAAMAEARRQGYKVTQ